LDQSQLSSVFEEIPRATMEADPAVCFVLDEKLRLIYCNPAWDRFAMQNMGAGLCAEKMHGRSVLDGTSGELLDYYHRLYHEVLRDRKHRDHDFHCSSPDLERLMRMHLYPMRHTAALLVSCSIRVELPHGVPSGLPVEGQYRNHHGLVVMCSNCRRTRRAGVEPETWDWVSDFVRHQPLRVSHSICKLCLDYYYS
jgi:hypothetical protein